MAFLIIFLTLFVFAILFAETYYYNFTVLSINTLPSENKDARVQGFLKSYRIKSLVVLFVSILVYIFTRFLLLRKFPMSEDLMDIISLFLLIFTQFLSFAKGQKKYSRLRKDLGFVHEEQKRIVDIDLAKEVGKHKPSRIWVYLAFVLTYLSIIFLYFTKLRSIENTFWILFLPLLLVILPLSYNRSVVNRIAAFSKKKEVNLKYYGEMEKINGKTYIALSFFLASFFWVLVLLFYFEVQNFIVITLALLVPIVGILALFFGQRLAVHKLEKSIENEEFYFTRDTSQKYKAGIYFDKNDERVFVPKQSGMGMTLNMSRPQAKAIMLLIFLPLLILMIFVFNMLGSKVEYQFVDSPQAALEIQMPMYDYEILKDSISEINWIEDASEESFSRLNGLGSKSRSIGIFLNEEDERVRLYRYNDVQALIEINTKDDGKVYLNENTEAKTLEFYEELNDWYGNIRD